MGSGRRRYGKPKQKPGSCSTVFANAGRETTRRVSLGDLRKFLHDSDVILERLRGVIGAPGNRRLTAQGRGERAEGDPFVGQAGDLLRQKGDAESVGHEFDGG